MSVVRKIVKNVFSNWAGYLVNVLVAFFISPFIVHTLGNTGYGIWVFVGSVTGYLGIMDFGMRPAIVKFVSRYKALGDDLMVNRVVNTMLMAFSLIGIVAILASLVLSYYSAAIFTVPKEYESSLKIIIIIVGLNVAASFPFGVFSASLNALQRFDINNIIQVSVFLVRSLFIVIFLKLGGGLITLSVIVLISGLTTFLLKTRTCFKINPDIKFNPKLANKETMKVITGFSIYTFLISIAVRINFQTDYIVIGAFLSAESITFYAIGATLIDYLSNLISNMSITITPVASGLDANEDYNRMTNLLIIGTKYCMLVILPVGITYLILGKTFINLWMGNEYGQLSSTVLIILMWSYFGYLSQFVSGSIFYGLGKVKVLMMLNVGTALINIVLSLTLVGPLGINGVALGTAIPLTIYGTIVQPIYICRTLHIGLFDYLKKSYLVPMIGAIPFIVLLTAANRYIVIDSFVKFWMIILFSCILYAIISFFVALESDHRKTIILKAKSILGA